MVEVWKDIEGFEGLYQISNLGRLRTVERMVRHSCGKVQKVKSRVRVPQVVNRGKGYMGVVLYRNSETTSKYIHRMVATAFIPNPENKPQVNHIDGDTRNNRLDNLEWATGSENQAHMVELGLISTLKPVRVIYPDGTTEEFKSIVRASKAVGVSHASILNALTGKTKRPRNGCKYELISKG